MGLRVIGLPINMSSKCNWNTKRVENIEVVFYEFHVPEWLVSRFQVNNEHKVRVLWPVKKNLIPGKRWFGTLASVPTFSLIWQRNGFLFSWILSFLGSEQKGCGSPHWIFGVSTSFISLGCFFSDWLMMVEPYFISDHFTCHVISSYRLGYVWRVIYV